MTNKSPDAFIVKKEDNSYDIVGAEILKRYSIKAEIDHEGSKQLKQDQYLHARTIIEPFYDPYKLCELLELNVYHENCVDVVARDSAGVSYDITPVTGEEGNEQNKQLLKDFFDNLTTPINETIYESIYDMRATGYGAIEIIRESTSQSKPVNFKYVPSYTLRKTHDNKRVVQRVGTKEVWYVIYGQNYDENGKLCDVHADTGEFHPYNTLPPEEKANELFWFKEHTPKSIYYGIPRFIGAIQAIHGDLSRARYNTSFFKNYGMPAFALMVSGDFADYDEPEYFEDGTPNPDYDYKKTLRYRISQQIKDVIHNPHSAVTILVPSEGEEGNVNIELQPLSVESKEASFRMYRLDNRDEIVNGHRVPGYKIGINETGNLGGSNIEVATENYSNDVKLPVRRIPENSINLFIRNEFEIIDWKFSITEHDKRDYAKDVEIAKTLFLMGCMTPRQIIEALGDYFGLTAPPEDYMLDSYYLNNVPLEQVWVDTLNTESDEVNILDNLEKTLIQEAEGLDEQIRAEEQANLNELESASIKKDNTSFKSRIQEAFSFRKTDD